MVVRTRAGRLPRALGPHAVGSRVYLRRPRAVDEQEFLALLRRSRSFHRPWEPVPPPGQPAVGSERFRSFLRSARGPRVERLLVCRREDGVLLGAISLNEIVRGVFQNAFLGYWIGAPHKRRGYMREALELTLGHAFGPLGLHRVEANVQPHNAASIALVRGAGFRSEGLARNYLKIAGSWCDHEHWVMLAEEWEALRLDDEAAGEDAPRRRRRRKA